jgi:NTE family protein
VRFISIVFMCLFFITGNAQNRPRVGLALSGGGAKSMAQIGALRVIEESGIKIDYISGTSMGAVIGAMYAMGYTVDEIEASLAEVDYDQLLSNDMPRNIKPFLNRNDEKYLLSVELNDGKINLPKAFNYGHYMLKILSYLTMQNHEVSNFEELPIPFLCMATDLETGESVVFDKGNLTDALRASVAYPSIFSPYEINGRLYIDGGVRNNLPIAVLKDEKNIDFVIAIDVQGKLYNKEELTGIVEVLEQVGSFPNMLYYDQQKKKADIIVRPPIDQYGITDYDATDTLIHLGYEATLPFLPKLTALADIQGNIPIERPCCTATPLPSFQVDSVVVKGVGKNEAKFVKSRLRLNDTGVYELKVLNRGLDLLYGSGSYEKAEFQYLTKNGQNTALIQLQKKPSRHSFRFGLHYDDDFSIALLANYTMRDLGLINSKFIAEVAISENPRGQIAYLVERSFIPTLGFRVYFNRFQPRLYLSQEPIAELNFFTYNADVFVQSTLFNNYTIGTGIKYEGVELSETIPFLGIEGTVNNYLHYYAFLDFDSFNRSFRPTTGFLLNGRFNLITPTAEDLAREASSVVTVKYDQALRFTDRFGMQFGGSGAATIGPDLDYPYNIFVGGLGQNYINFTFPFVGYRFMELIGRNFVAAHAWIYYEFFENHFITAKTNFGKLESTVDELFSSDVLLDGYGLSYAYKSPIGPMELTVMGSSNHAKIFTYISLGFWF